MAVPPRLLQQLLALDESVRRELAHALLASVDPSDDDGMNDADRATLHASIERSFAQSDADQGIPVEHAIAELRAKRAARARGAR